MSQDPRRLVARGRREYLLREIALRGNVRAATVAEHLGVSEATVRRDIVHLDAEGLLVRVHGGAISVPTSRRVEPAKTLIGVVVPDDAYHFQDAVLGMRAAAVAGGGRLVVGVSQFQAEREAQQVARLVKLGVHGLIISPTHRGSPDAQLQRVLEQAGIPVVLFERAFDQSALLASFDCVRTDDVRGAMMAVEHLAPPAQGAVGLAIYDQTPTAPLIREGYEQAVANKNLDRGPVVVLPKGEEDPAALDARLLQVLEACMRDDVHAVLVHPDRHAARLIELAMDRGVKVPEDVAIVAYDDIFAEHALVPLSAITAPRRELGRLAVRTLLERIAQAAQGESSAPQHVQLLPTLTIRESSLR